MNRQVSRQRSRPVLRFLTLVFFLHFSGLNNGYTYFLESMPLNAAQSAGLAGSVVKDCTALFLPQRLFGTIHQGYGKIAGFSLTMQRVFRRFLQTIDPIQRSQMESARPALESHSGHRFGSVPVVGSEQEKTLKKETWNKLDWNLDLQPKGTLQNFQLPEPVLERQASLKRFDSAPVTLARNPFKIRIHYTAEEDASRTPLAGRHP